jgi:GNAT superfamily N-acetyltransferase
VSEPPHPREREVTLRDGRTVTLRPICPEDAEPLQAGLQRLSPESRYRRFLSPIARFSSAQLRYMTDVDHHDHEALVAIAPRGELVGVARSIRARPGDSAAEAAVVVADDWQRLGLGKALLAHLADRAREEGVGRFTAVLLSDNTDMLELFEDLGSVRTLRRDPGTIEIEIELPGHGVGPLLDELLRGSAGDRYDFLPTAPPPSGAPGPV